MRHLFLIPLLLSPNASHSSVVIKESMIAHPQIHHLDDVLRKVQKTTGIPVAFPSTIIGRQGNHYYAYAEPVPKTHAYIISIDSTEDCHGAHYCSLGSVRGEAGGSIEVDYGLKHKTESTAARKTPPKLEEIKKISLKLAKGIKGYYTPGYTAADYHSAKIQWINNSILYTIEGFEIEDPVDFIKMANSAIMNDAEQNK